MSDLERHYGLLRFEISEYSHNGQKESKTAALGGYHF